MRPSEGSEIQQYRLRVLNLRETNGKLARHIHVKRCDARERWHTLKRNTRCGFDRELVSHVQRPHENGRFDGFDPENCRHLQGLGVWRIGCGLAEQEGYVVDSAPEEWWSRSRGNDNRDRLDDFLFGDDIAQQLVRIVQQLLRDRAGGDKAAEVLRNPRRV